MLSFILLLLIIFVLWPLVRFGWTIYHVRRQYNDTVNHARQAARQAESANRPGGWSAPRRRPAKVVRPDEGEYVEWEEVSGTTSSSSSATDADGDTTYTSSKTSTYSSERISDAEWEDVNN